MFGILRTILAVNVILLHIFNVPALGNFSVTFFFMLSGFLMTLVVNEKYGFTVKGFFVFWLNRILRLYPLYWVVLLCTVGVLMMSSGLTKHPHMYLPSSLIEWGSNLTMVYANIVPSRIHPRIIPPSWAISNELVYYLLISLGISRTKTRSVIWFLISVLYFIYTYLFYDLDTFRYGAIPAASLAFSIGAVLYWYKEKLPIILKSKSITVLLMLTAFYLNGIYNKEIQYYLIKDISIYMNLIISFFLINTLYKVKTSNRLRKIDNYVGLYSYPFYIFHYLVALIYSYFIGIGVSFNAFIVYFVFLGLFTALIIHFIDYPIENYRKKLKKHLD